MKTTVDYEKRRVSVNLVDRAMQLAGTSQPGFLEITPATETRDRILIGPGGVLEGPYWRASGLCLVRHHEKVSHGLRMVWPDGSRVLPFDQQHYSSLRFQPLLFGGGAEFQSPVGRSRVAAKGLLQKLEVTEKPSGHGPQIVTADKKNKLLGLITGTDGIVESVSTALPFQAL